VSEAYRSGVRGIIIDDVWALIRRCHRLHWAQCRTLEILSSQATTHAKLLDNVRKAVQAVDALDSEQGAKQKARHAGPPQRSVQLLSAIRSNPTVLQDLKIAVEEAQQFRAEHAQDGKRILKGKPKYELGDGVEVDEARKLLDFVLQSTAAMNIQRRVRGMARRALVAKLIAQRRHSQGATLAFSARLTEHTVTPALVAQSRASKQQHLEVEEQRLEGHFLGLQKLRRELHNCAGELNDYFESQAAGAQNKRPASSVIQKLQHIEVTSRLLVKELETTGSYIQAHMVDDPLAKPGAVDALRQSIVSETENLQDFRSFLNHATIEDLHRRHSIATNGAETPGHSTPGQAKTLRQTFLSWKDSFESLDNAFEGIIVAVRPVNNGSPGQVREVLERVSTHVEGLDGPVRSLPPKSNSKRIANHDKAKIATPEVGARHGPQLRSPGHSPSHVDRSSPSTYDLDDNSTQPALEDDEELLRVINEEMELRQLQTVLAEAQFANHRQVRSLQRRLGAHDADVKKSDLEALENDMMSLEDQYSAAAWSKHDVVK